MKSKIIITFYLIFFVLTTLPLNAQSVDSLITEALQNNPQLKALQARIESAEYRSKSTGYLPQPTFGVEFSQVPFNEANPLKNAFSQDIMISQMFPLGGKLEAMQNVESKNISIAERALQSYKLKLISEVRAKYYEIWMIEHHMVLRDEVIDLLENLLNSTAQLYTTGAAKYSDVIMIKAALAENKTQAEILQNDLSAAVYEMNALLGREVESDELNVFHHWKIDSLPYSADEVSEILINSNPDLKRMDEMIEMNQLEISMNNKELIPDLMLQASVMRMPRGMLLTTKTPIHMFDGSGETEYMYSLMASITLPFAPWSSGKYSAKEEELNAAISGLSSEKNNMKQRMIAEVKGLIKKLKNAERKVSLLNEEIIPLYRSALKSQLTEFQTAKISINDLISTMRMLLMKEEEMAEAEMEHQMILAELESIAGQRLTIN